MTKDTVKITLLAALGGVVAWLLDAYIDAAAFGRGSFWSALTTTDAHEHYMRALFLVNFIVFGMLIALFTVRRKRLEDAKNVAEKALHENEHKLQAVMESIADSIYLIGSDYRYLYMNKKHSERLGLKGYSYVGRAYGDLHSFEETEGLIETLDQVFTTGETVNKEHYSSRDGRYFLRTLSPVRNGDGKVVAVSVVSKDVHDLKQMEKKLRSLSMTDELTGLYNRRGFFTLVEPLLKLANRNGSRVFLLYCDLDNLKEVNDELGHHEGDRALLDIAGVLRETFRESDLIARIGGDEFIVVPVARKKEEVEAVTDRLNNRIRERDDKSGRPYRLSISIGMSCYDPEAPSTLDQLLKQAEKLMYEEKSRSRGR